MIWLAIQLMVLACACPHPAQLREIYHFDTRGWAHDLSLDGGTLYMADRQGGYLVFQSASGFQDPLLAAPVRDVISLSSNSGMLVLASRLEGLVFISPSGKIRNRYSNGDIANAVQVRDNTVFAAYGRHGLVIIRLINGRAQQISQLPANGWSHDLRLSREHALIADWKGLKIVDISNPEKPSEIAFLPSGATCISLAIKESEDGRMIALAEGHAGIAIVRMDDMGHPLLLGRNLLGLNPVDEIHPESGGWVHSVDWAGRYLFAANWKRGLAVLDALDPKNPRLITEYPTTGTALGVKTQRQPDGSYLVFLADGESGLRIFRFIE